ncbi:phosphate ABC transporter, permease protein PstA [gamma proteobacterium HTCC5015]|nr:phosphate ABC transporter, permease protein PstA [gamma proteobacterium HTCC5015]
MTKQSMSKVEAHLARRYAREKRFRFYGLLSVFVGFAFLVVLFTSIISKGYTAFQQTYIQLDVTYDADILGLYDNPTESDWLYANYDGLIKAALRERFPEVTSRSEKRELYKLVSSGAKFSVRDSLDNNEELLGTTATLWVLADDDLDSVLKGHIDRTLPEADRRVKDQHLVWIDSLVENGEVEKRFNTVFFTHSASAEPEQAGVWGAIKGSFFTLIVTLVLSFPVGVAAAVYLEEFAPQNRWTDLIEVNINNLAAVPSIVFGLLGLAVFLNFMGLPRSAPLVGGLVLTLMTLPTIIISSRAALKAVPPSIREAALGMGASRMQTIFHHVLPLAMPGMLTGTIIGMAQALGESAPLLMIGMVAFVAEVPQGITDPATVLPVQIFQWADLPERGFVERTSAAIMVLLAFLIAMNAFAVYLRKRFERRW